MFRHPLTFPLQATLYFICFIALVLWRTEQPISATKQPTQDRVVLSAPVLTFLYGADHFLAANIETFRLAATGMDQGVADIFYLIRAHKVVSELNPCHEDNLYLANALLTWGGAVNEGEVVIKRAADCRLWDEMPPFLYGFNQYFFNHNIQRAQPWLEMAAERSPEHADNYRAMAIMFKVKQFADEKVALEILRNERENAGTPGLKAKLDTRIKRLEGLATLRDAQRLYEKRYTKPLKQPDDLLKTGILEKFPKDPTKVGYEFIDGKFRLTKIKIAGVEDH